jgi:hypothetical protein
MEVVAAPWRVVAHHEKAASLAARVAAQAVVLVELLPKGIEQVSHVNDQVTALPVMALLSQLVM